MADSILKIRTQDGDKPIGYPGLADKPVANKTLDIEGAFADAKVVGDKFKEVKAETDSLKEDIDDIKIGTISKWNQGYWRVGIGDKTDRILSSNDYHATEKYPITMLSLFLIFQILLRIQSTMLYL